MRVVEEPEKEVIGTLIKYIKEGTYVEIRNELQRVYKEVDLSLTLFRGSLE
jgi:hypothetical protein